MAIFTSHISGSSGGTSLTGSLRLMSPHGTPQDMILTASFQSFGPSIGIGTSTTPNTAFAINSDLGLSDDATNSRFSIANTNAYVNLGTDVNNRSFVLWENGSSRLRIGTKQSGVNYFNTLHLKSGQVGIGGDSSGMDLHVRGPNKTAIIGPPSGDPLVDSTLYFANDRTFIGHDTEYGGNFVLASTASILLGGDRDNDGAVDFVYLKGRNDLEDVRVEAPAGMNIDNNLSVTGSVHIKGDGSGDERLIVSGSGHDSVSITPGGSYLPGIKVDRDSETAIIGLRRVQTAIDTGDELARIELGGSETGGGSSQGGGAIVSTAAQPFSVPSERAYSDLSFHNTSNTSGLYAVPAMTFSGSLGNVAHFNSSIYTDGNLSLKYGGGPAQILVGNSVAMTVYDSNRNVEFANDIIVGTGIIQNGEGEETITMSEYADVVVRGNLSAYGGEIEVTGSNPTITIGDASVGQDVKTIYKGQTSYYMGADDTDQKLYIGQGTAVGSSVIMNLNTTDVTITPILVVESDEIRDSGNNPAIEFDGAGSTHIIGSAQIDGSAQIIQDLVIGQGSATDRKIVIDGNAQDFYVGLDDSEDALTIGAGQTVGSKIAAQVRDELRVHHNAPVERGVFRSNSYQVLTWGTSMTNAVAIGAGGGATAFRYGLNFATGHEVTLSSNVIQEGLIDLEGYYWTAPCDGAVAGLQIQSRYRWHGDDGGSTSNIETVRIAMNRAVYSKDTDDTLPVFQTMGAGAETIQCSSTNYNSYDGFFGGTSQNNSYTGEVHSTKRVGVMGATGNATTDFGVQSSADYNTADGSHDMEDRWTFSKGDRIAIAWFYAPYGSPTNAFFDENTHAFTDSTNYVQLNMIVRLDWTDF